jgi:hypothetical protein
MQVDMAGNNDHMASATKFSIVRTQTYDEITTNIRNDVCSFTAEHTAGGG